MTDKQKNLIVRSITGILFVVCMVSCFLNPRAMIFLFTIITGLSIWEYCGLVNNEKEDVTVNRLICTIAGVYFFLAVAGLRMGIVGNFIVFVPYLLTIVYLFISELYTGNKDAINDWVFSYSFGQTIPEPTAAVLFSASINSSHASVLPRVGKEV